MYKTKCLLFLLAGVWIHQTAYPNQLSGMVPQDSVGTETVEKAMDSLGRSTPQGTARGFFEALRNENYLRASDYFDLAGLEVKEDTSRLIPLMKKVEFILNREGTVLPLNILSDKTSGDTNDGLDPALDEIGSVSLNDESIPIYLELTKVSDGESIWLFSPETIEVFQEEINSNNDRYEEQVSSDSLLARRWNGGALRDWIGNILLAIGAYLLAWLITVLISWIVRRLRPNVRESKFRKVLKTLLIPLRLVIAVGILLYLSRYLGVSIIVRQAFGVVNLIALWTAVFIFIWLLIDTLTSLGEEKLRENQSFAGLSAVSFFRNTAKFVLIVVALLIFFDTLGVDVTAGLAALGVGGIALALGAQKTIENIIGGLSVVFDQPVSVGDFCKFGDTLGTVEKIGMRSTRLRTTNRTVVTVPNSDFSSRLIENFSKRDLFLFHTTLGLRYETSSDQMRYILIELRKLLYAHPKVDPNPARVRFLGYGSDALQVEIFAYTIAKDYNDYLGIQEDLNLRLAKVIENSGSGFAFPSQTLYLSRDEGLSEAKKKEAEKQIQQWIEDDELGLPEFKPETIESLKGTIRYPPKDGGSRDS